jgi:hypothetical protein
MNVFRSDWFRVAEEVQGQHQELQSHSQKALRNMMGYCYARVVQLCSQRRFLDFQARQQLDLHELLETCRRLERAERNYLRFAEKYLLIKLELARREHYREKGDHYET